MKGHRDIGATFSRAASTYDRLAIAQRFAADRLLDLIQGISPSSTLEVGCGTCYLTKKFLEMHKETGLVAIDFSPRMLKTALQQLDRETYPRLTLQCQTLWDYEGSELFDLVISSSAMHWMTPYDELFSHIDRVLKKDGLLAFSCMLQGTLARLRNLRRELFPQGQPTQNLPSRQTIEGLLDEQRFITEYSRVEKYEVPYQSADEMLHSLSKLGVLTGEVARQTTPLHRGQLKALLEAYELMSAPHSITAEYEIGWFIARKT